jgi:hypothetical protein
MSRQFLTIPVWVHREEPLMGGLGLGRLRWGWIELTEQQWLDVRRREAMIASLAAGIAVVIWATLVLSGCKC